MNLNEEITKLQAATKRGELPRELRMIKIDELIDNYFAYSGKTPDVPVLEKLADLCLHEELTDPNIHKVAHNEYPFLSEHQFDRRDSRESSVGDAIENNAADRRSHLKPTRRSRTDYENQFVDKKAKIRNKERKRNYNEFTKIQPVYVRKMSN